MKSNFAARLLSAALFFATSAQAEPHLFVHKIDAWGVSSQDISRVIESARYHANGLVPAAITEALATVGGREQSGCVLIRENGGGAWGGRSQSEATFVSNVRMSDRLMGVIRANLCPIKTDENCDVTIQVEEYPLSRYGISSDGKITPLDGLAFLGLKSDSCKTEYYTQSRTPRVGDYIIHGSQAATFDRMTRAANSDLVLYRYQSGYPMDKPEKKATLVYDTSGLE
jgi:hypothetical protein